MTFRCEHCGKSFKKERTLFSHMCPNKKRWLQRDEQHVKLGLTFFNEWYRIAMGTNGKKDYKEFMKSQYYGAFVRFGLYVLEARVLAPERYLVWLIERGTPVDRWCKDSVYNLYLSDQSKKETAERALERFVINAEAWSTRTGHHWTQYWSQAPDHVIVNDIKMGKISPWVFMGVAEASSRIENLPGELITDIADTIDLDFWARKIKVNTPTIQWIEEILHG